MSLPHRADPPGADSPGAGAHSTDTLLLDSSDPGDVDRLNDVLQAHDLGRPLGQVHRTAGASLVIPVTDVDPAELMPTLRSIAARVRLDPVYYRPETQPWTAAGHGEPPPPWKPVRAGLRRPVVALLDSGVQPHPWLPAGTPDDPFLLFPDDPGLPVSWTSPVAATEQSGHATFLAGIVRMTAPSSRILSVPVMGDDGRVSESTLISALHWLLSYHRAGRPLDVVCMPFGRPAGDQTDQEILGRLGELLRELHAGGVELVAAAGNDHRDTPIFPAAFDVVTAVGSGSGQHHAAYSNYGPWVDRYRDGDVLSIVPGGWARWSGTSFAAAAFAGDVARPQVAKS